MPWIALTTAGVVLTGGGLLSRFLWKSFTNPEARRRDLEDRVRNWLP
jgi:hypothetical protein